MLGKWIGKALLGLFLCASGAMILYLGGVLLMVLAVGIIGGIKLLVAGSVAAIAFVLFWVAVVVVFVVVMGIIERNDFKKRHESAVAKPHRDLGSVSSLPYDGGRDDWDDMDSDGDGDGGGE